MAVDIVDEFEIERLLAEIQQEKQMKEMLDQSSSELRVTVEELEKRFDSIENEGNEWKTRFETQEEMNQQLQRQILNLQNKLEEARRELRDANKSPRDNKHFDDLADANPHLVKTLEKDKTFLINQLRDLEWRLDQESKAYHKANEERKQYVLEINLAKGSLHDMKMRQKVAINASQGDLRAVSKTPRGMLGNIPDNQRILDPRRGPIRKIAAVKSLPSLDMV